MGGPDDVDAAVAAAEAAFESYSQTTREDRLALLDRIIEVYATRMTELGEVISTEMGAPAWLAQAAQSPAGIGHFMTARKVLSEQIREQVTEMLVSMAKPAGFLVEALQHLQHRQRQQLSIRQLRRDPDPRPPWHQLRAVLQHVINARVQCNGKGVQIGVHEDLQGLTLGCNADHGHPAHTKRGPSPLGIDHLVNQAYRWVMCANGVNLDRVGFSSAQLAILEPRVRFVSGG